MRALAFVLILFGTPLTAHEFWLEPHSYQLDVDETVIADLVNGEDFDGPRQPYLPQRFVHFALSYQDQTTRVSGRVGDSPALQAPPMGDGLHVYAYQSTYASISYTSWDKFQRFVDHKDFGDVLSLHQDRGLPLENFSEAYARFSKTLVGVGSGAGSDRRLGLETEIVALTNPFTDDLSAGMRFQLFDKTEVRPNVRFEVYEKSPDGDVIQTFYQTDDKGIAIVPVRAGYSYMADAVILREPEARFQNDVEWQTLWANMTWFVPE